MKASIPMALAVLLAGGAAFAGQPMQADIDEGKQVIKAFFGDLKGELQKSMKSDGPVQTIGVCNKVAPSLASKHSQLSGWRVGRTSLKVRNPDNAPDDWERAVLKEFEARKAAGEDPKKLMKAEVVEIDGHRVFRMMKAIPTAKVCTKCHGTGIAEPVKAKLDQLYPQDRARGFRVGDLRGAFTLQKPLD